MRGRRGGGRGHWRGRYGAAAAVATREQRANDGQPEKAARRDSFKHRGPLLRDRSRISGLPRDAIFGAEEKYRSDAIEPKEQDERRRERTVDVREVHVRQVGGKRVLHRRPCDRDDGGAAQRERPRDASVGKPTVEHDRDDEDECDREQIGENMRDAARDRGFLRRET